MLKRAARLTQLLKSQREIVVRVRIGGSKLNSDLVGLNRFLYASGFVEHVAQIEISQGVAWIGLDGLPIVLFREPEFLPVVVKRPQIDVGRGVGRLQIKNLVISRDRFGLEIGVFF